MTKPTANKNASIHALGWAPDSRVMPGSKFAVLLEKMASTPGWTIPLSTVLTSVAWHQGKHVRTQMRALVRDMTRRGFIEPRLQTAWMPDSECGLPPEDFSLSDLMQEMTLTPFGRDVVRECLPHVKVAKRRTQTAAQNTSPAAPHPEQSERLAAIPSLRRADMCGQQATAARGPYIRPGALDFKNCPSRMGDRLINTPHDL